MKTIRELARALVKEHTQNVRTLGDVRRSVRTLLEGVLLEARFQTRKEVLTKHKDDPETIKVVNLVQKSLDDTFKSKSSKYFPIVFDYIVAHTLYTDKNYDKNVQELLDDAIVSLMEFDKIQGVDLNKFASFEELESFVQDAFLSKNKKNEKTPETSSDTISAGDSTLLFEDDDVVLYRVNSPAGANALAGKDTTWCIARKSGTYFNQYTSTNQIFYFAIDKNLPVDDNLQKVAIRVTKDLNSDRIVSVNYTSKRNDGDNRNPRDLSYYEKIKSVIERDASSQPPTLMVKVKSGRASQEEIEELWNNFKSSTLSEKEHLAHIVGSGVYDDKINEIKNKKFDSIPSDWKNLDAALIERLVEQFHDDNFYKKVLELHNPFLDKSIANNTHNKYILRQILLSLPENDDLRISDTIAQRANDVQTIQMIMDNPNFERAKYIAIMYNDNTPQRMIELCLNDKSTDVKHAAISKTKSEEFLRKMSRDDEEDVRVSVASNVNTPQDILDEMSHDVEDYVLSAVSRNPNTSQETLWRMLREDSQLGGISSNPNVTLEMLEAIVDSDSESALYAHYDLASDVKTPVSLLKKLSKNDDEDIRDNANKTLKKIGNQKKVQKQI